MKRLKRNRSKVLETDGTDRLNQREQESFKFFKISVFNSLAYFAKF